MKNLIVSRNPARRSAKQKAASKRNIKKAQAARRRGRKTSRKRSVKRRRNTYTAAPNPRRRLPTFKGIIDGQLIPAAVGGAGAVIDDLLVNFLPLPAQFKTGWMRHVTKAIGAVLIGYIGGMFLTKRTADQLGAGAMTVVGYNVAREMMAQFVPAIPLGEYLDPGLSEYLDPALGYYGAGMDPSTAPGAGMETAGQFTRGSPYVDTGMEQWPTGSAYDEIQY
jgi:hypothetical protein